MSEEDLAQLERDQDHTHGPWSRADNLLAALHDAVERLTYVQIVKSGAKNVPTPQPLPRPGVKRAGTAKAEDNQRAFEYLEAIRAAHREGGDVADE